MRSCMWGRLLFCWLIRASGWMGVSLLGCLRYWESRCVVQPAGLLHTEKLFTVLSPRTQSEQSWSLQAAFLSWALLSFIALPIWDVKMKIWVTVTVTELHFLEKFMARENHSIMQHHGYARYEVTAPKLWWWQSKKLKLWGRTKEIFTRSRWKFCTRFAVSRRCGRVKTPVFPRSTPAMLKLVLENIQENRMNFLLFCPEQETLPAAKI